MGVNRYYSPAQLPTGQDYFKLPFNELYTALGAKQKQQDDANAKNLATLDAVDKLQSLDPDSNERYQINDTFKSMVDNLTNMDLTSPEGKLGTQQLTQKAREVFGANGRGTAIANNYLARVNYEKKLDEYLKANKDVDPNYKTKALAYFDNNYAAKKGIGQLNANKSYNKYDTEDLSYINVDDVLEKAVSGNISDAISNSVENPDHKGYFLKKGTKNEWVSYEDIVAQATEKALSDPSIASHVGQGTKFGYYGQNDFDFKNAITTTKDAKGNVSRTPNNRLGMILDRLGRKFGFNKSEYSQDYSSDATWIHGDDKEDKGQYYDDIDAATWNTNPFGEDVTNAGSWVSRLFGNTTPKYQAWSKKINTSKSNYEKLKSQVETNNKKNVVDIGLNNALKQAETDYNSLQLINSKLDKLYSETQKNIDKPLTKLKFDDPEVQARYDIVYNNKLKTINTTDKAKFFEQNFDKIASQITTKQKGIRIQDNDLYNQEIRAGLSSQKGKQVFSNNGEQLNADFTIPTGVITRNTRGIMNLSYGYFSDEKEAKKAGIKVVEMTGEEANSDANKAVKEDKSVTVAFAQYPKDATVYRVQTLSEPTTYTKNKYDAMLYTPSEQKIANDLNYNINAGLGGVHQISDHVTIFSDSDSKQSPYSIVVTDNGKSKTYRFESEEQAIKMANKLK